MTDIKKIRQRVESDAQAHGYYLNYDSVFLSDLFEGLKLNEDRYGYPSCPCRLASGDVERDRDIICPCDYRDADVKEFGSCYCALFLRKDIFDEKTPIVPIPEHRFSAKQEGTLKGITETSNFESTKTVHNSSEFEMNLWYCKQCGYVCFREEPPYTCPICKADKKMFSIIKINLQSS